MLLLKYRITSLEDVVLMLYLASSIEMLIAVFALTKEKKKVEITMRRNFSYEKNIFMQI